MCWLDEQDERRKVVRGGGRCTMLVSDKLTCCEWGRGWTSRFAAELEKTSLVASVMFCGWRGLDSDRGEPVPVTVVAVQKLSESGPLTLSFSTVEELDGASGGLRTILEGT